MLEFVGLASAKQTFLPPGVAVYAPQSPNWPSRVGCGAPGAVGGTAGFGAAGFGAAGGLAAGACCCADAAPATPKLAAMTTGKAKEIE